MKRRIVVEHGDMRKIAASMGCTREMVGKALRFDKNSILARKIRHVAKEQYGGIEIGK